jgi:large subunit ribosomal protein L11
MSSNSKNPKHNKKTNLRRTKSIKVKIIAGSATPAPPLGPALGQAGIKIQDFVKEFNDASADFKGQGQVITKIQVYEDRSYTFQVKTPITTGMILKELGLTKGSVKPGSIKAGKITQAQLRNVATKKMEDLNANTIEQAVKIIAGSARSAGLEIVA